MALPTCPKCNNHLFTFQEMEPSGTNHKYQALTCSSCGCIITIIPFMHTNDQIRAVGDALGKGLNRCVSLNEEILRLVQQLVSRR